MPPKRTRHAVTEYSVAIPTGVWISKIHFNPVTEQLKVRIFQKFELEAPARTAKRRLQDAFDEAEDDKLRAKMKKLALIQEMYLSDEMIENMLDKEYYNWVARGAFDK